MAGHGTWAGLGAATVLVAALATRSSAESARDAMGAKDHVNLERNLRWILARERAGKGEGRPALVGVLADVGSWHTSARSVVSALEDDGVPCRPLDVDALTAKTLAGLRGLVLPGGWASLTAEGLTEEARQAVRAFVEAGGRCVGLGDGAFTLSREVAWKGEVYRYGLGLFDGIAEGPLAAIAPWPDRASVRVSVTEAGKKRGLAALGERPLLYWGGPRLLEGTGVEVLARYPDGTAASVARRLGKGEVVLVGLHVERPPPEGGDDASPAPAGAAGLLRTLLALKK